MPTIVQTVSGKVSGLWGAAMVRGADGKMHALQLGDIVHKGDVILTAQNGIVQLSPDPLLDAAPRPVAAAKPTSDIDRVIADLGEANPKAAPAAGAADGALAEGLRVGRVVEGVTPLSFEYGISDRGSSFDIAGTAIEPATPEVAAVSSVISALENGARVGLGLRAPAGTPATATVTVNEVPLVGQVLKADGTVLAVGMVLTPADLAGLAYVPPAHYANETVGPFVYTVTNGPVSAVGRTDIAVAPVNEVPALVDDVATGPEGSPITGNVIANDRDPDGDPVRVVSFTVGGVVHAAGTPALLAGIGQLVINPDGRYTFTPEADYNGPVPVATYTATDGELTSTATLTLAVTPVNDPPVAGDDIASTPINRPIDIAVLANDKDVDGDVLTVSQPTLANPAQGTVTVNPDGTLHFVPATNLTGPVTITYTVTDPNGATDTATVTVNVGNNTPPDSADKTVTTAEDTPVTLTVADFAFTDADAGQALNAVRIDTLPASGTLLLNGAPVTAGTLVSPAEINAGQLTYAPAADGHGAPYATFTFSVQDSGGAFDSTPNTLTLDVTPVNDPPVAVADTQTTDEDTPVTLSIASLLANDTDADGDPLTLVSVQAPQHGTVAIINGNVVFTPEPDYNGPASFTYTVQDPSGAKSTATVNVNVTPVVDPAISISDVTVNEGAGTATFVVTLSEATTATVSVKYQTGDASATGADYGTQTGTLTFAPGVTSQTVSVSIANDTVYERSESFNVTLSQPTNATIADGSGIGTILDDGTGPGGNDSDIPTLAVTAANALEGTAAVFTVTLSNPSTAPVVFTPSLASGTAAVGTDTAALPALEVSTDGVTWQPVTGNVTIPAGATSVQLRLPTTDDALQEATESFSLTATPVSGAATAAVTATAAIIDNDGPPSLSIDDVTVNEAAGTMTFTVTLAPVSGLPVTVDFATANASATAGADYTGITGTLTFAPNVTTQTIEVKILDDATFEGSETFTVVLSNPVNAAVVDGTGIGTIRDDGTGPGGSDNDTPQVGGVSSPSVAEGGNLDFAVTLTHPSTTPTTVSLTPASGSATLGTDTKPALVSFDGGATFAPLAGPTVSVPAGATSFIVRVPTVDDTASEPTETLTLAAATPANTAPVVGTGTITDNDGTPALAISGPVLVNEAAGTATFTVTLSNPSSAPVSVNYGTVNGTATAGGDFAAGTGTLNFAPGVTSQTVTITINDDTTFEGTENFSVVLSTPSGATIATGTATTTIADNGTGPGGSDNDAPAVGSVSSPTVVEGNDLDFTVTLTNASTMPTTVTLTPASGTASLPADTQPALVSFDGGVTFVPVAGPTVDVPAGVTSFIVRVPTVNDTLAEPTEAMTLAASTPVNAAPVTGTGTISDNDAPVLGIAGPAVVDEAAGTATYTVTLSNPSSTAVTVGYASSNGTATAGADYVAASGTLTFAPGETTKSITVSISNDTTLEHSETLTMSLATPTGATIAPAAGTVTTEIVDDGRNLPNGTPSSDDTPSLSIAAVNVAEGAQAVFTVTLSNPSTSPVVFTPSLASGTAAIGTDTAAASALQVFNGTAWVPVTGNVTIAPGATSVQLRLATTDDITSEANETFTLTATPVSGSTPTPATGIATIVDNDGTPQFSINDVTVNEGAGTITFTVSLSNPAAVVSTIGYAAVAGTASTPADVAAGTSALAGTLTFPAGVTSQTITLNVANDAVFEGTETFTVNLSNPTGGTQIADGQGIGTIKDDGTGPGGTDNDTPAIGSVSSPTVAEGGNLDFAVTLTHPSTTPTTVTLTPANGTATLGTDTTPALVSFDGGTTFVPVVGSTVSVPANATSFIVRVPTVNDTLGEPTEAMTLGAATPANTAPVTGTGTITDNDTPVVSISGPVTVNEAAGTVTYTVTLSNPATTPVTVNVGTAGGSATSATDFGAVSSALTFAPGVTSQTVTVAITDDATFEGSETFSVNLSAPSGATLGTASSTTTIVDDGTGPGGTDDDRPAVGSVSSPTVAEGGNLDFTVTLTNASTTPTTVALAPASGTATLGTDTQHALVSFDGGATFVSVVGGTVSVPANATSFIVRVPTVNDTLGEPTEAMTLAASTPANTAPVTGTGSITDNDTPVVSISGPVTYNEAAGTATYTVTLSNAATTAVTVNVATANGTATAGADYTAVSNTLTFAPGVTSQTVTVAISNDTTFEGAETFSVNLSAPSGATLGTASSLTTITDDGTGTGGTDNDRPAVGSVSSPTIVEGGNLDFAVTLTHPSTTPTTVTVTPANGTAVLGTDTNPALVSFDGGLTFTAITGPTVSVPAGASSFIVRVPTVDDLLGETNETITLAAQTPVNTAPVTGTGTITDNDTPVLSISGPVTYNEAAGTATYTVTMSTTATTPVTVNYATANGTATAGAGADYTAASGTLTFAPGETSKTVTVTLADDTTFEGAETFTLNLSAPVGANLGTATSTTTIVDDGTGTGGTDTDRPAVGTVSSPTVAEGNDLDFAVTLTHPSTTPTTVTIAPTSGTATLGTDTNPALVSFDNGATFTAITGPTVAVPAGVTNFIVRVPTVNDTLGEPTEAMTLAASTPVNTAPVTGTGSITDNDTPVVSISGPVTYNEAAGTATYTVTLSNAATTAITVNVATANGTATAGADYTAVSNTLTFAPGVTSQTVTVAIANDTTFEGPETFSVNLSAPSGATLGTASSVTTITDDGTGTGGTDDDRPAVGSVSSPTVGEGNNLDFAVVLNHPSTTPTTVTLAPASGTATLGTDTSPARVSFDGGLTFTAITGPTVTVPAGVTNLVVRVPTVNDTLGEPTEAMTLAASTPANTAPVTGTGSITDNDTPVVSISGPVTYNEAAGTATYTVTLSNAATTAITVNVATANGTATAGADYTAVSNTLTFAPGVTSQTVTVAISNDTTFEGAETFSVNLSAPSGATLGTASSLTTITDDGTGTGGTDNDRPAVGSVSSPTIVEGGNLDFAVTLTHPSTTPTTVTVTPANGTAVLGTDTNPALVSFDGGLTFTAITGPTVSVPAGASSFIVRVPTVDDLLGETNETITLAAQTPVNTAPVTGTGTITDNDTPVVSISGPVTYNEATGLASYTVTLSTTATTTVTVNYATANGTAAAGADYLAASGTLTFAPGVTSQTVFVAIINDTTFEGPETFTVNLSAPVGANLGTATSTTTIVDNGTGTGGTDDDRPAVASVSSPTVVEGNNLDFAIALTRPSTTPTTVTLTPTSGTATVGTDTNPALVSFDGGATFTAVAGSTVAVPAGVTNFIVRLPSVNDTLGEPTESFTLGAATSTNVAAVNGTGTITDNDTPVVSISGPVTYNEGAGTATYTVTLSNPATTPITVNVATQNGTAIGGSDFTSGSGILTFAPGVTSQTFTVALTNDATFEGPETFNVVLFAPTGATLGTATSTTTIVDNGTGTGGTDNDTPAVGTVSSPTVVEGNNLDFTVALTNPSTTATTVTITPASGTATLGSDTQPAQVSFNGGITFTAITGTTVSVPAGSTSFIVRLPTVNDTATEPTETLTLAASTPANAAPIVGTGTITDNDAPPALDLDANNSSGATGANYTTTYTENAPAVSIADADVSVTDVDSANLTSATVTLTNAQAGDVLAAGAMPAGIVASVVGNVVTLTGNSSLANYQTAIRAITFVNTTEAPNTTPRLINVVVTDGTSNSNVATTTVNVVSVNDAPVAAPNTGSTPEDTPLTTTAATGVLANDSDVDGPALTVTQFTVAGVAGTFTAGSTATVPAVGTLVINANGSYTFTPAANYNGTAPVATYTVSDGTLSTTSTLTLTVTPVNDAPVGVADSATAVEAGGVANGTAGTNPAGNVLTNDTDPDAGDSKTVSAVTGAAAGTVGGNTAGAYGTLVLQANGSYVYTVNNTLAAVQALRTSANTLTDTFNYTVRDAAGVTSTTTLTVTVQGANDAPVATVDTATAVEAGGIANGTAGTNPSGNVLTNDTDVDAGDTKAVSAITGAAAGTVGGSTAGQYGTLTLNADGSYTYVVNNANTTVNALKVGQSLVDAFTYTMVDAAGATSTATLNVTVQGANDAPVITAATVAVSEEGLAGGQADTLGTSDTTNSATVSGTLVIADAEGDAVTAITVTAPAIALTSNGVAVTWASTTVAGVQTLTATAGATTIGTLTMNTTTGAYTFTLNAPIDHAGANVEDVRALSFGVTATAGGQASAVSTLTVNVEDDAPNPIAPQAGSVAMIDTNLELVLDVSGSMSTTDGVGGTTRLASAIASLNTLLDKYDEFGNVAVKLVTFSTNAQSVGAGWTTVAGAKAQLAALAAAGGTNYDEALGDAITAFGETGKIVGAQNIAYFFTDGLPTFGSGTTSQLAAVSPGTPATNGTGFDQTGADTGIQAAEETLWTNFLNANQVKSFAIAFGAGVTNTNYLDPIAYDGQASINTTGTLVASFNQLDSVLAGTVQNPVGGQLVSGGLITAGGAVGADGGYIKSITIEGTTYTYDPSGTGSVAVTGTNRGTFDTTSNSETVTTTAGGQFIIDLDNGVYSYKAPPSVAGSIVETMNYIVTDRDGDTQASSISVNVDRTNVTVGTAGNDTMNGVAGPDLIMGADGNDIINGGAGNDTLLGGNGNDTIDGGIGNDTLRGGAGTDILTGGDGIDRLSGGAGNDTLRGDAIAGPLASDTFAWELADRGTGGTPAVDTVQDFSLAAASANGDVLDLRDLLVGENKVAGVGNLQNYLDFDTTSVAGQTTIRISSSGGFTGGTYAAAAEDQRITLTGVDLRTGLGLATTATDNQIIQELLNRNKLVVDG